jgi:hypothetical protein
MVYVHAPHIEQQSLISSLSKVQVALSIVSFIDRT